MRPFLKRQKILDNLFLRNVEIIVLVDACGQIGQKQIGQIAFVDVKSVSYRL